MFLNIPNIGKQVYFTTSMFAVGLSVVSSSLQSLTPEEEQSKSMIENPWSFLELLLNSFFMMELFLTFLSAPSRKKLLHSLMVWCDILAVCIRMLLHGKYYFSFSEFHCSFTPSLPNWEELFS